MGVEKEFWYEYGGNRFCLERTGSSSSGWTGYIVRGVRLGNACLRLPENYDGNPVVRWHMRDRTPLSMVRFLFIPASVTEIFIDNRVLPQLEHLEVQEGNPRFSTDGQMLYSADGRELLYSLGAGWQDRAVVPSRVRRIRRKAFQYTVCGEILFRNPDVSVEENAFDHSAWKERQGDFCLVGNMFYRLNRPVERLRIPEGVRRFHESAFSEAVPEYLDTPVLPPGGSMEKLGGNCYRQCRELTIRRGRAALDPGVLRRARGLEAVHIGEGYRLYSSADGVVYSRDGRTLEYYPPGKMDKAFAIPEGVVKIARSAFAQQRYLEEIHMPDSVTSLGMGAFCQCSRLRKVRFSEGLREIPDACPYQKGGVFEECGRLEEAVLPGKLQYLGSYAFFGSGLRRIWLNEGLRQTGEYALAAKRLEEVELPATLERLGKGALLYAHRVGAWIGTARGLVPALNAVPPEFAEKCANVEWTRCMVHAYHRGGEEREEVFLIPGSLKRDAAYHLDMAWNGEEIDYGEYDACFAEISDPEERLEFAGLGILRSTGGEYAPYTAYLRHTALKVASRLAEERKEEEFLAFLKMGYLSDSAVSKLLKLTAGSGMAACRTYLLKMQEERGGGLNKKSAL